MRTIVNILVIAAVASAGAASARAQMCGDVTNNQSVTVSDLALLLDHIAKNPPPPLPNPAGSDLDTRAGVTVADAVELVRHLFSADFLSCTITGNYSFSPRPEDTLFVPRILNIPENRDSVLLPVRGTFTPGTRGLYLPLIVQGPGSNGLFALSRVDVGTPQILVRYFTQGADTTVLAGASIGEQDFTGAHDLFSLKYARTGPGVGSVAPLATDRNSLWRVAVERDGDLFLPTIVYYDYVLPPDTLQVVPGSLSFDQTADELVSDTLQVTFTSSSMPIGFELTPSEPWVMILPPPSGEYTTPATLNVVLDLTDLSLGQYTAAIAVTSDSNVVVTEPQISLDLNIREPNLYPNGDFNCDGRVTAVDALILVAYLFKGGPPLLPCPK